MKKLILTGTAILVFAGASLTSARAGGWFVAARAPVAYCPQPAATVTYYAAPQPQVVYYQQPAIVVAPAPVAFLPPPVIPFGPPVPLYHPHRQIRFDIRHGIF